MRNVCLVLILTLAAVAAMADSHSEMKPSPELRKLDYFAGTWMCKGTAFANPMAPEHATEAEVMARWDLDGNWLGFAYAEKKTTQNPKPFKVSGYFGYDMEQKTFVIGGVDNMGGYSTSASMGWNGDSMVYEGPWHMGPMTAKGRDTFMKKNEREMWHSSAIEQDGKWVKMSEENCTRK